MKDLLFGLSKNIRIRETVILYVAMVTNLILGYVIVKFNTAYLSLSDYGRYSFFMNTVLLTRVFFSLGLFEVSSRSVALAGTGSRSRQIYSATLLLTMLLGLLLALCIFGLALIFDHIFEIRIGSLLLSFAPFAGILLFQMMLQILLRGFGYIKKLSLFTFMPRLLYLAGLIIIAAAGMYTLFYSLFFYFITLIIVVAGFVISIRVDFRNLKQNIRALLSEIKSFGAHLYAANILSTLFYHSDKLLLAYFLDAEQLAFYALAFALTFPLTHFSNALSTAAYKKYANQSRIDRRDILLNLLYIICVAAFFLLLREHIVLYLFSEKFAPAIPVLAVLTIAVALNGLSIPYTTFFKAHREGERVRNITLFVQVVYFILNLILIPKIGIMGAAWAALIAFGMDYILYLYYYRKLYLKQRSA